MPRSAVKCLILVVVCLAIFSEIEGLASSDRGSRSRSRSRSPPSALARMGRGVSRFVRSISPRRNGGGNGASTSRRAPRSRSQSPETPLQRVPHIIYAYNRNDEAVLSRFASMYEYQGNPQMTLAEFIQKRDSMIAIANSDTCPTDIRGGGVRCVNALNTLQAIPREWRGPCRKAFSAQCYTWPAPTGLICSFFMKISTRSTAPLEGYDHRMRDCANALSPEQYEKHLMKDLNDFADSLLAK